MDRGSKDSYLASLSISRGGLTWEGGEQGRSCASPTIIVRNVAEEKKCGTLGRSSYHPVNIWFEPVPWSSAPLWLGDYLLGSEDVKLLTWQMPLYYLRPR